MISIIVAVRNQLAMNKLFWSNICMATDGGFELIVVDNGSTDGTREFFCSLPSDRVRVVANEGNYSYPYCQNQGIAVARGEVFAFLNNDQLMSRHWDSRMLSVLGRDGYHVLSCASVDCMGDRQATQRLSRRWKRVKYPIAFLFGHRQFSLRLMVWLMYGGRFGRFCDDLFRKHGTQLVVGFSGSVVVMDRRAIEVFGGWDPSMQSADFDCYCRTVDRYLSHRDIQPLSVVRGVYAHHFRRLTLKGEKYPPFVDADSLGSLAQKWQGRPYQQWIDQWDNPNYVV